MSSVVEPRFLLRPGRDGAGSQLYILCGGKTCRNRLGKTPVRSDWSRASEGFLFEMVTLEPGYYQDADGVYYRSRKFKHNHDKLRYSSGWMKEIRKQAPESFPDRTEPKRRGPQVMARPDLVVVCPRCGARNCVVLLMRRQSEALS